MLDMQWRKISMHGTHIYIAENVAIQLQSIAVL
jgi:hypothetical protein